MIQPRHQHQDKRLNPRRHHVPKQADHVQGQFTLLEKRVVGTNF
jgi:hypothetical protein